MFPNVLYLLEAAVICPISNATVERLFSKLRLVKTDLRNQLGDRMLDLLLRIKMELTEDLNESDLETLVNLFKSQLIADSNSGKMRIDL